MQPVRQMGQKPRAAAARADEFHRAWLQLGDRYRVVVANPSKPDNYPAREREEAMSAAMQALVERGQAGGEFSDLPAAWGVAAMGSLLVAMIGAVGEGRVAREDALRLLVRSVLGALRS